MCVGWKHTSRRGKCWASFSEYRARQSRAVNMRLQLSQIRAVFEASWQPTAGENHRRDSPTHLSLLPLTMATSSEGNNQAKCVRSKWIAQHLLTITQYSQPLLTDDECKEIANNARCLRRVANPFGDFYFIVAIGAAGSPTSNEVAQTCEDKQTRDHARNLYVFPTSAHHSRLISTLYSTPIQHKFYVEDFNEIIGHLPFLKKHLESNEPSNRIQRMVNKVRTPTSHTKYYVQPLTKTIDTIYRIRGQAIRHKEPQAGYRQADSTEVSPMQRRS